jgi:hypothetical protein
MTELTQEQLGWTPEEQYAAIRWMESALYYLQEEQKLNGRLKACAHCGSAPGKKHGVACHSLWTAQLIADAPPFARGERTVVEGYDD